MNDNTHNYMDYGNDNCIIMFTHGQVDSLYQGVCEWAAETPSPEGGQLIDQPWVQHNLAKVRSGLEVVRGGGGAHRSLE